MSSALLLGGPRQMGCSRLLLLLCQNEEVHG
jgi:hypothetical protein